MDSYRYAREKIDVFQRQLIRRILNIPNNNWIRNEQLYERAVQQPWTTTSATRRLRAFGHIGRLPDSAPAKKEKTLHEGLIKKPLAARG